MVSGGWSPLARLAVGAVVDAVAVDAAAVDAVVGVVAVGAAAAGAVAVWAVVECTGVIDGVEWWVSL